MKENDELQKEIKGVLCGWQAIDYLRLSITGEGRREPVKMTNKTYYQNKDQK